MSDNIKYQKGLEYADLSEDVYSDDPPQIVGEWTLIDHSNNVLKGQDTKGFFCCCV